MTTATLVPPTQARLASMATFFQLTLSEYHEMIRNNILTTEDRVEFLDGYLVNKMPQNNPHSSTVERMTEDFVRFVPKGWRVRIQLPITLTNSEPEPDGAVVRGDRRTFDHLNPTDSDFGIVIEVADTTLSLDRREKGRIYAEASIPEYWIVNIPDRQIEVYTLPDPSHSPPIYTHSIIYTTSQSVPIVLDGKAVGSIPVAGLLP